MGQVRMFRDRVVSMEQTQEIGEKNIELLTALASEALEGFGLVEHGLEHEQDLYVLSLAHPVTGEARRVAFTRMVLADADRLPAIVADAAAPIRSRIVDLIRGQAERPRILVSLRELLSDPERAEADDVEAEWRQKHEAALAAKKVEEERVRRERQRQKQQEDARRQAQREREKRQRAAQGGGAPQAPAAQPGEGGSRRRRRRGRGGQRGGSGASEGGQPPQQQTQALRPVQQPRSQAPQGGDTGAPRPEGGGGGRRRRRRGRGRGPGGNAGGGAPPPAG